MLPRQQRFYGTQQVPGSPILGRLGQRSQDQLHGRVHVFKLLRQLLHHKLEAEPPHLRSTSLE